MFKVLGSYCEIKSQRPKTKCEFVGTISIQNRCVDFYKELKTNRVFAFDGIQWVKTNRKDIVGALTWANQIVDWKLD